MEKDCSASSPPFAQKIIVNIHHLAICIKVVSREVCPQGGMVAFPEKAE